MRAATQKTGFITEKVLDISRTKHMDHKTSRDQDVTRESWLPVYKICKRPIISHKHT